MTRFFASPGSRGMSRTRTRAALAALAALTFAATGCANVPSGGRVVSGKSAQRAEQVDDPYVRVIPVAPRAEWGPEQIVSGFLAASGSFDDDHKVAREYVSGPQVWEPGIRPAVTVFQDRELPIIVEQRPAQATVEVRGDQLGKINRDGQYTADPKRVEVTFQLARTARGLWRVTSISGDARTGLLLTKNDVDRAFRTVNLFFFAPDRRTLVPNGIFLPLVNRQELPTRLVQALLTGPTSWLGQAVRSAFPAGTRLRGAVSVSKQVATVDLTREARGGNLERMSAQLSWTLRQLSEIKQWRLRIEGREMSPSGMDGTQPVRAWEENAPDGRPEVGSGGVMDEDREDGQTAYMIGPTGDLNRLSGDTAQPVASPTGGALVRPAVAPDFQEVAGLSPDGDAVLAGDMVGGTARLRTLLSRGHSGARYTAPSWDAEGRLWTVESTRDKSWLWVRPRRGLPMRRVGHWGLSGREVLAFRVARDGVRAAVIVKVDGRAQVQIGRIVRDAADGTEAGSFLPVSSELVDSIDLVWRDYGTLAVLGRKKSDSQVLPYLVPVSGGAISSLGVGAIGMPRTIAAAPGSRVLIGTRSAHKNQICRQRTPRDQFSEWECPIPGSDPTYPR